jgi:hypothetical protein
MYTEASGELIGEELRYNELMGIDADSPKGITSERATLP